MKEVALRSLLLKKNVGKTQRDLSLIILSLIQKHFANNIIATISIYLLKYSNINITDWYLTSLVDLCRI